MTTATPVVSVIVATFNRSNVLRLAIESVLRQTRPDWEVVVVGDACTDDSADVVAAFGDPRIRWHNLERNVGEQSGPNNAGVQLARGRYLAFLNHDDLYMPDHLERSVDALERTGADLVFALGARIGPDGAVDVTGATAEGRYSLLTTIPASTWVLTRAAVDAAGPWPGYRESRAVPSQAWLVRAHKAGLDMRATSHLTVLAFPSNFYRDTYAARRSAEQEEALRRMEDPDALRRELLGELVLALGNEAYWPRTVRANVRLTAKHLLHRTSARFGVHPVVPSTMLRGRSKGWWLPMLTEVRGLPRDHGRPS